MDDYQMTHDGLLILPHLEIQNANAISGALTHGFPSITAFVGFMWALNREFVRERIGLRLNGVGVICHSCDEQVSEGYIKRFCLTRNPVEHKKNIKEYGITKTDPVIEEGRVHLDISLVFSLSKAADSPDGKVFLQGEGELRTQLASRIAQIVLPMRIAGGSIISEHLQATLVGVAEDYRERESEFIQMRKQWLPGFTLVSRHDILKSRWQKMKAEQPTASLLDALLDLSRFNYHAKPMAEGEDSPADEKVEWVCDRPKGSGWIVPISVGYATLSPTYDAGSVRNARDMATSFRFVEALYSIGEWVAPHHLTDVEQLLWYPHTELGKGLYRVVNRYIT